jgi:hypothetical protein
MTMRYRILKDFMGSQDGRFSEAFSAGSQADLSDYLVSCVPPEWIRAVSPAPAIDNKAIITDGAPRARRKTTSAEAAAAKSVAIADLQ